MMARSIKSAPHPLRGDPKFTQFHTSPSSLRGFRIVRAPPQFLQWSYASASAKRKVQTLLAQKSDSLFHKATRVPEPDAHVRIIGLLTPYEQEERAIEPKKRRESNPGK
jgi:hypothetical protein